MLERVNEISGRTLDRPSYHKEMARETRQLTGITWKLERSQFFKEPDSDPAWQAFVAGQWGRTLQVFESERPQVHAEVEKYASQGSQLRRLRIVDHPVSSYLQWEMHSFKVLDECGMPIRVLDAERVRDRERVRPLPEVVVVGHQVLYEIRYDAEWAACGARRIDDPDVISAAGGEIAALWNEAEPLREYFQREIAPLALTTPAL